MTIFLTPHRAYDYSDFENEQDALNFAIYWFGIVKDENGKVVHDFQTRLPF